MAIDKNKKLGKKGAKKKSVDPLSRKEWYDFKAPVPFIDKSFGKTCVTKTTGTKIASEQIKNRVVETTLAELKDNSQSLLWRKVKLIIDDVQGNTVKTSFYGLDMTRDKLCSFIRKRQTLIEAVVDCKSQDDYAIRIFIIAFTKPIPQKQKKKTCYAQHTKVCEIRKKITELLLKEVSKLTINDLVSKLTSDTWTEEIPKLCKLIFPLQNVFIRKVKMIKRPKIDAIKLNEMYSHDKRAKATTVKEEDKDTENLLTAETKKSGAPQQKKPRAPKDAGAPAPKDKPTGAPRQGRTPQQ